MSIAIQQGFIVDGKVFATKAEAQNYLRRPKILEAFMKLTSNNTQLAEFMVENQDSVEAALDTGTIRRVTKTERNQLAKALEHAKTLEDSKLKFIVENADAILETFRWPSVKRLTGDDKANAQREALVALSNNEDLADWVVNNSADVLEAYKAGIEKREVSPVAAEALAAYRAKKAAEKAAAQAQSEE